VPFGVSKSDRIKPGELDDYAKLLETCKEKSYLRIADLKCFRIAAADNNQIRG
jgi:hypothetical protein